MLEIMHVQWILGLIMGLKIEASIYHISDLGFLANYSVVNDTCNSLVWSSFLQAKLSLTSVTEYSELPLFRATYLGTDLKLHQDCTNLVSDLRSPRYSVLQPLLETPISAIVFILQPEVIFVGVVMIKT